MPRSTLVQPPQIMINGQSLADQVYEQLVELRVEQSVSLPSRLILRMSDPDFALIDGTLFDVGAAITISLPGGSTTVEVFDGEIVTVGIDQQGEGVYGCELVVSALDRSHRLGHDSKVRTFQKVSYADIVRTMAGECGLAASVHADASHLEHEYVIQTTTNFAFLNEMAFRLGYEWRVEASKLTFGPRAASAPLEISYVDDLRRFKARFGAADRATSVTVQGWDASSQQPIKSTNTAQLAGVQTTVGNVPLGANGRTKGKPFAGKLVSTTLGPATTAEATSLAEALGTRLATAELSARGEIIGHPEIKAGTRVKITGMGTKLSGEYYITTVEHIFGRNTDLITRFTAGGTEPASIVDLLGGASERMTPFGRLGVTVAIVTNNKDPDEVGRVKVKFPTLSGDVESAWARLVGVGASAGAGLMVVPEINDEVLVGFQDGDLRFPYVLGGLWSVKKKPPATSTDFLQSSKVVQWGLTTKGGHSMQFVEGTSDDKSHFTVQLADKKTTLRLGKDKVEIIANDGKPIELKNNRASIVLAANGDITIKGSNVTIEATQALKATGLPVEIKSNSALKAEAAATLELKGGATAKLESSGITEVKGSMVKVN
jgi:uncharacterized protein involved in type VI secretion and phage assembly